MINHFKLLINETAHKIKKSFIIYHETVQKDIKNSISATFFDDKKSYNNGSLALIFNISTII